VKHRNNTVLNSAIHRSLQVGPGSQRLSKESPSGTAGEIFYMPDALLVTKQTISNQWRCNDTTVQHFKSKLFIKAQQPRIKVPLLQSQQFINTNQRHQLTLWNRKEITSHIITTCGNEHLCASTLSRHWAPLYNTSFTYLLKYVHPTYLLTLSLYFNGHFCLLTAF